MMDTNNIYNWKVIIIAQYHSSWAPEYNELIDDIKKSLLTSTVRFLVMTHNVPNRRGEKGSIEITQFYKGFEEPNTVCWGESDFYDGMHIQKFFKEVVLPVKAEKLVFMVWGHSAGLGYLTPKPDKLKVDNADKFKGMFEKVPSDSLDGYVIKTGKFEDDFERVVLAAQFVMANRSMTIDPKKLVRLRFKVGSEFYKIRNPDAFVFAFTHDFPQISAAEFAEWLGVLKQEANIFIASTCYSQVFESGYALRKVAKYMVAAQTTYPLFGFDYRSFFTALQLIVPLSDEDLVQNIVYNFPEKYTAKYRAWAYSQNPEFDPKLIDKVSISANDLRCYERLLNTINLLATILMKKLDSNLDYIEEIWAGRNECKDMAPYPLEEHGIIDFTHYVQKLEYKTVEAVEMGLKAVLADLETIKKDCNKAILAPRSLYRPVSDPTPSENPEFFSIFHPSTYSYTIQEIIYAIFYQEDAEEFEWDNFIRTFVERTLAFSLKGS